MQTQTTIKQRKKDLKLRGKQEKMQDARMKQQQIVCDFKLNKNAIET